MLNPTVGLFETVSLTVAGSSAVLDTFLGGEEEVLDVAIVAALVVLLILGVRYGRTLAVDERTNVVPRVGTVTVVRGSSGRDRVI